MGGVVFLLRCLQEVVPISRVTVSMPATTGTRPWERPGSEWSLWAPHLTPALLSPPGDSPHGPGGGGAVFCPQRLLPPAA